MNRLPVREIMGRKPLAKAERTPVKGKNKARKKLKHRHNPEGWCYLSTPLCSIRGGQKAPKNLKAMPKGSPSGPLPPGVSFGPGKLSNLRCRSEGKRDGKGNKSQNNLKKNQVEGI